MTAKVIKFRPRPIGDGKRYQLAEPTIILVLPMIRIERYGDDRGARGRRARKRRAPKT